MLKIFGNFALAATLIVGFPATPLLAQPPPLIASGFACAPHEKVIETLKNRYVEKQAGFGVIREHFIIEVFVSDEGSWTIVRTDKTGTTCIMATGHSWQQNPLSPGDGV